MSALSAAILSDPITLVGTWTWQRTIDDRLNGTVLTARGTASFTPQKDGSLLWIESGTLLRDGTEVPVTAERSLFRDDTGWAVRFSDGRYFHPWNDAFVHDCEPDLYTGSLELLGDEASWVMRWSVRGPRKNYEMTTIYRR